MFLKKYLNDFYYNELLDNYKTEYLNMLDEQQFLKIYKLLIEYNFYFIEDIILKYLEIFELDVEIVKNNLEKLKEKLGDNFVYIIGNNMTYLDEILNVSDEE